MQITYTIWIPFIFILLIKFVSELLKIGGLMEGICEVGQTPSDFNGKEKWLKFSSCFLSTNPKNWLLNIFQQVTTIL